MKQKIQINKTRMKMSYCFLIKMVTKLTLTRTVIINMKNNQMMAMRNVKLITIGGDPNIRDPDHELIFLNPFKRS